MGYGVMNRIQMAQVKAPWRDLVDMVIKILVLQKTGEFLSRGSSMSFLRKPLQRASCSGDAHASVCL
jgi:hypothetical protein